jgi:hypothetical protein
VEDSDNAIFTRHTFVFFGGDEVGEALAGVFLISVLFSSLALLVTFDFLGWWRPLNTLSCSQCFLIVVMRLSTLGLVEATFSSCTWLGAYVVLDGLPHLVDIALTCSRVGSGCLGIPLDSKEGKEAAS